METQRREHREEVRSCLTGLLAGRGPLKLVEAALWIAAEEYPRLDVARETERVRLIARVAADRVVDLQNPFARIDGLRTYMYDELGFRGNLKEYDDPRNSYLNEVLDRRLGMPLTLSLLYRELAGAAGFATKGVALPGHFVVRLEREGRTILIDAFNGGHVISEDDCRELVARSTGKGSLFRRSHLEGVTDRAVLGRLLLNLKHSYLSGGDYVRALSIVDRLLIVWPTDRNEIRDRGFLKAHLGHSGAAIADLEAYLHLAPEAPDQDSVKGRLAWLRRRQSGTH